MMSRCAFLLVLFFTGGLPTAQPVAAQPVAAQPVALREGVMLRQVLRVAPSAVRLAHDPSTGALYTLTMGGDLYHLALGDMPEQTQVASADDHGLHLTLGLAFGSDGTLYLVGNDVQDPFTVGVVMRGVRDAAGSEARTWTTVARSAPYPRSNTAFDHNFNGVAVSPEGAFLFVNSGSRTDHGEVQDNDGQFPGLREVPLTSAILRIPTDAEAVLLPNDHDALVQGGYLFADGTRNSFDLTFAPNGDLLGTENAGDRDDSEELNWLREGRHYGFPWHLGGNITPQQFPGYDPDADPLVNPNSYAYQNGFFYDDPAFPPPPEGRVFTEPIANAGPDADHFRNQAAGQVQDASDLGVRLYTFTSHRSPLGLVFDADSALVGDLRGGAFVMAWTGTESDLLRPLDDPGEDLLHLDLEKQGDVYDLRATRIVQGFENPIDAVMMGQKIYVIEFGGGGSRRGLWEVDLSATGTATVSGEGPRRFTLEQNYPNPFNPETTIRYHLARPGTVRLGVYDVLGREVAMLAEGFKPAGEHAARFEGAGLPSGLYVYRLHAGAFSQERTMLLVK